MIHLYKELHSSNYNPNEIKAIEFIMTTILNFLNTSVSCNKEMEAENLTTTLETLFLVLYDEEKNIFLEFILDWFSKAFFEEKTLISIGVILEGFANAIPSFWRCFINSRSV